MTSHSLQSAPCVLMVRPACFYSNPETAKTNEFQHAIAADVDALDMAQAEFDGAAATLREAGVQVVVVEDTESPQTPDALFPNNWLTTHADGSCVLYPMQPESRRGERRLDVLDILRIEHKKTIRHVLDWSDFEHTQKYLEGTGSLVLDRQHRVAYACRSARTDETVLRHFCRHFDYTPVLFDAFSQSGTAIYHTNVMMCVGTGYAVVCLESIRDERERAQVVDALSQHRQIIDISYAQVAQFAGNMLEVRASTDARLLVMSSRAYASLTASQISALETHANLVQCRVDGIEDAAGGGIRCMLAEIFLP
ncbi:MAG: arginine deiminase-related protein [Pseudomonadota bacterium]